jgi:RNA polymerase sigma-70 factor (ECF subfamily)
MTVIRNGGARQNDWSQPPSRWLPEWWSDQLPSRLLSECNVCPCDEHGSGVRRTSAGLLVLRDIEEGKSEEVCDLLELSEVNQRVLLPAARSRRRAVLEADVGDVR